MPLRNLATDRKQSREVMKSRLFWCRDLGLDIRMSSL